jgi:hypothetical protein
MPDFCTPRRGVRQTVDTALASLQRLGVEPERVVLRAAGAGWVPGTVITQEPAAGHELTPETRIVLDVAGTGALESLPYPLREDSEDDLRVDALFALFDTPLLRVRHAVRQAGGFLELRPENPATLLRWIEGIFQVSPKPWSKRRWYAVARLLPTLHRVAGRTEAIPLALRLVFGLPVASVRIVSGLAALPEPRHTRLATANSRLGTDAALGVGLRATTAVEIMIGPVSLETYQEHQGASDRAEREAIYRLVVPAHLHRTVRERWTVGTPAAPPRLRDGWQPAALGLNSYLGGRGRETRRVE